MRVKTFLVFLGAATLAASAIGQTKTSGTAQCKSDPPAPVPIGDTAGHAFSIDKAHCTWTGFAIGGVPYKDGVSISMNEIDGDKSTARATTSPPSRTATKRTLASRVPGP